jgi:phosphonate transport system substrate-binding protein
LQSLEQLQGATVAFPAPAAFAATVLPLAQLLKQGIVITPKFVGSHDSVYLAVAKGFYPAGGGIRRTFEALPPQTQAQYRILGTTAAYTPHAFAAHPRVDAQVLARLSAAMFAMHQDPAAEPLLQALEFQGFAPARDADWDDVRELDIRALDHLLH